MNPPVHPGLGRRRLLVCEKGKGEAYRGPRGARRLLRRLERCGDRQRVFCKNVKKAPKGFITTAGRIARLVEAKTGSEIVKYDHRDKQQRGSSQHRVLPSKILYHGKPEIYLESTAICRAAKF